MKESGPMNGFPDREKSMWLYVLGELPEDHRQAFAEHLVSCPSCRTELRRFEKLIEKVKTAGRTPTLPRQRADAMTRRILDRFEPRPGVKRRRWLSWPKLVPSLAAACALLLFVGIFSYRALDREKTPSLMSGLQKEQTLSPDELQMIREQDMELLMEFQTVQKLVQVLDTASPEGRGIDNDDSAWRIGTYAVEA
jgi:hypothetical protein